MESEKEEHETQTKREPILGEMRISRAEGTSRQNIRAGPIAVLSLGIMGTSHGSYSSEESVAEPRTSVTPQNANLHSLQPAVLDWLLAVP